MSLPLKGNAYTCRGGNFDKLFLPPFFNGSKFFPFRVDLFEEGTWYAGKLTANHKSNLLCKNGGTATYHVYIVP